MPDPNSKPFARRLREAALNREPADAPELRAEAATSETNERLWLRYAVLESAIEAAREHAPRADLRAAVLAELRGEGDGTRDVRPSRPAFEHGDQRRGAWFAVAAAAAAALLLTVLAFSPGRPAREPDGRLAGPDDEREAPHERLANTDPPRLENLLADASAAYAGLARETRTAFAEVAVLVPEIDPALPAPPPEEPSDWVPPAVRDGVDRTLDFLFEPPLDEGART